MWATYGKSPHESCFAGHYFLLENSGQCPAYVFLMKNKYLYLCDLSRDYYNLLERTINGETESFIYDNNVVSMSKAGSNYYYLQDELGSPRYMTNFTIF